MIVKTGLGQDSHRFDRKNPTKRFIIAGVEFEGCEPLEGNSDADVVLHAITNAVSSITGVNVLGKIADQFCEKGITDSRIYLKKALEYLHHSQINHVAITIEGKTPTFYDKIDIMKKSIADILGIDVSQIGITATSGEELSEFGKGNGLQVFAIITVLQTEAIND